MRSDWTPIDLSHIPVKAPTRDSGGQNTVIFMKLSTRASSLFLYVFSLERNAGKVYRSVPKRFFGIRDFPYLKLGIFKQNSGRDPGFKILRGSSRWDAKYNQHDYGMARNFGSGLRD